MGTVGHLDFEGIPCSWDSIMSLHICPITMIIYNNHHSCNNNHHHNSNHDHSSNNSNNSNSDGNNSSEHNDNDDENTDNHI